jgi:hypothetical protein
VELLLNRGADIAGKTNRGLTPLHLAAQRGHYEMCNFLLECGASYTVSSLAGKTPLHLAAENGKGGVCTLLLDHGASPKEVDRKGKTAIDTASSQVVKDLLAVPLGGNKRQLECGKSEPVSKKDKKAEPEMGAKSKIVNNVEKQDSRPNYLKLDLPAAKRHITAHLPTNPDIPAKKFMKCDQPVNANLMTKKFSEFNAMVTRELRVEDGLIALLPSLATATPSPGPLVAALATMLTWPDQQLFPALDLARVVLLCPVTQHLLFEKDILDNIFTVCLQQVGKEEPAAHVLALHCLVNMFSSIKGEELLRNNTDSILTNIMGILPISEGNRNIQIAAATLALNYAVSIHRKKDKEIETQLLTIIVINFFTFISDYEARFLTLVAAGTMLTSSAGAVDLAKTLDLKKELQNWATLDRKATVTGPSKVSECASIIEQML